VTVAPLTAPRVRFVSTLASRGDAVAVWDGTRPVSYAELAGLVAERAELLGAGRRLVLIACENTLDALLTYLGALHAGHVPLLAPGDRAQHLDRLVDAWDPDVVAGRSGAEWVVRERRAGTVHTLNDDLALLLTTSGSTGSPKLVRLSHENLDSNAEAIAEVLDVRPTDRAMTSLPMHYCYGLSVVHSHLARGAGIVLTDLSVVAPCFWDLFDATGATTLAGVPHSFDLLDRSGFADREHPTLRVVTQAGGRLAPEAVQRYAALGRERGWHLYVMYGQTEATARMAVLPPDLVAARPETVGLPVPGGSFRIDPLGELECGLGELVYSGPNVMLGYAEHVEDLARGRDLAELRTGDLARVAHDELVEIVGRRSRFAKVVGLRIDLDHVERDLRAAGHDAHCVDLGDAVGVLCSGVGTGAEVSALVSRRHGIPASSLVVLDGLDAPRLPTGKPDYPSLAGLLEAHRADAEPVNAVGTGVDAVVSLYRQLLDAPGAGPRTRFVDLGGDSLSYVEVSLRLEQLLGTLPAGWHLLTPEELARERPAALPGKGIRLHRMETSVVVRCLAIVLILANHTHLAYVPGGAHTLLALVGFNLARFQLTARPRGERVRGILRSMARIVLPSSLWIAALVLVTDEYDWRNVLMLNQVLGDWSQWSPHWHYWFIEAVTSLLLGSAVLMAFPFVDRWERRWPFAFPMALVAVGLLTRYDVVVPDAGPYRGANAYVLIWLFATGWAAARARTTRQRLLVSAVPVLTVPGFWPSMPGREATIVLGILALTWLPTVAVPGWLARFASQVATASLFVYLTHFSVYPYLMAYSSVLAMAASIAVGVAYWWLWGRLESGTRQRLRSLVTSLAGRGRTRAARASSARS
jgi:acyl-CoA synthetase (AMP-forming)/AMP-acid ligase II